MKIRILLSAFTLLCPLLASALEPAEEGLGFVSLFDGKTFAGWEHAGNWVIEDGAFYRKAKGGSLTYTTATVPDDFELRFEWKVSKGCNSGVYYRPGQVEYQILDNVGSPYGENARQAAASIFFCMAPKKDVTRPVGKWNTARILCKNTVIEHWLNGERVLSFDYTSPKWAEYVNFLAFAEAILRAVTESFGYRITGRMSGFAIFVCESSPMKKRLLPIPILSQWQ